MAVRFTRTSMKTHTFREPLHGLAALGAAVGFGTPTLFANSARCDKRDVCAWPDSDLPARPFFGLSWGRSGHPAADRGLQCAALAIKRLPSSVRHAL